MYSGSAAVMTLALWVLLDAGTYRVVCVCDPGESNYTTTVTPRYYYDMINTTIQEKTSVEMCCPGYSADNSSTGMCIESGCLNGTYGDNCTEECSCPDNAYDNCDSETGNCTCLSGWYGTNCSDVCEPGHYGADCQSTCECENQSTCDPRTGYCTCHPGWEGHFCEKECMNHTYGDSCNETCNCTYVSQKCDHVTGSCDTCEPGWRDPPRCDEVCELWSFGQNCSNNCSCHKEHTFGCSVVDGTCICKPGYRGINCKHECPPHTYGSGCNNSCDDMNCTSGFCDKHNGSCYTCYGKQGPNCTEECPRDTFGFDCLSTCQCSSNHSNGTCDSCSGACHCNTGWTGYTCDLECPAFMVDTQCQSVVFDNQCDPDNITWSCADGWTGEYCNEVCAAGLYGQNCSSLCMCDDDHECNPINGQCCTPGTFGQNCSKRCTCNLTTQECHHVTGECICRSGWTGDTCKTECPLGTYGFECALNCTCDTNDNCHHVNGSCDCMFGWDGDNCAKALHETQDDEAVGMLVYILAAGGAVLLAACVLAAAVCLTRRKRREANKTVFRDSHAEFETRDTEQHTMNDYVDSAKGLTQMIQQESGERGNITNALVSAGEDAEETSIDTAPGASLDLHKGMIDEDASYTSEHLYEGDEHYADVDNEENTSVKPLPNDTLVIDDEHNSDYDTSESLLKNVIKTDTTYDKFENLTSQAENYDVITRPGIVPMPLASNENYCTFEQVRQQSKKGDKVSNTDENRVSDSYDNLEYRNRKEQCLNFDTSLYNMGTEFSLSQNNEATAYRTSNAVPNPPITKNSELTAFNNENKRLSENIYEECPEDIDKTNDEELKEENNQPAIEEHYERLSAAQNDAHFDKKTDEIEDNIPNDEMDHQPFEKDKQISDGLYEDCLDENIGRSNSAEEEGGNSDQAELYEKVSDNDAKGDQTDPDSPRISSIQSYENYKLPLESHEQEHSRPNDLAREVESNAQSTSNPSKDRVQTLKSKERKAVDYEQFQFKMK